MLRSTATTHVNRNWARAQINTYHRRQKPDEKHQAFKGGRIRGEMFDGSIGTDSLSAKFSFHKIKARTKALETEAQNEMWLTRPYLSKEETDFMNNGVYTPKRNIEHDENVVLDDFGGVINRGKHTGRLNPEQIKEKFGHEMLPLKYVRGLKQKQEQSEIMNRKQLKPDVRGADIWKSMEKYRTWERDDEVDLDFYRKYHNMAVPKAYPTVRSKICVRLPYSVLFEHFQNNFRFDTLQKFRLSNCLLGWQFVLVLWDNIKKWPKITLL